MKVLALTLSVLVALALAEPPVPHHSIEAARDSGYFYFARNQPKTSEAFSAEADAAPYPPSGWRPDGPAFDETQRQQKQTFAPQKQQFGSPVPQRQFGASNVAQKPFGSPAAAQKQFGSPAAPQRQYGAPLAPQKQFASPAAPQRQYGAPAAPQTQYGAPAAPQTQYGAPATPQIQYGAPENSPQSEYPPNPVQQRFRQQFASQRQYVSAAAPQQQYLAPAPQQQQYSAPSTQYGAPVQREATTTEETTLEYDESTTLRGDTEPQAESVDSVNELDDVGEVDAQQREDGEYFVALPDGRLQRVISMTRKDLASMKYFARITAENVEPLRGPIYAYTPLQKLEFVPANLQQVSPAIDNSYGAPQKLVEGPKPHQPLAAIAGSPSGYNADSQSAPSEQRLFITI